MDKKNPTNLGGKLQNDNFADPAVFNGHPDADKRGTDGIFMGPVAKYPGADSTKAVQGKNANA